MLIAEACGVKLRLIVLTAQQLLTTPLPFLVHLKQGSGCHFAVLTGMAGDRALLADPSQGHLLWSLSEFLGTWTPEHRGPALAITADPAELDSFRAR